MSEPSFFRQLATFCHLVAPAVGPFLDATGNLSSAIDDAQRSAADANFRADRLRAYTASLPEGEDIYSDSFD